MRFTRRNPQSGQSLVEVVVASALAAVGLVIGLQTLDSAALGARLAAHQGWAACVVRGEMEAVSAAPWSTGPAYPAPAHVTAQVVWTSGTGSQAVQKVRFAVTDPDTGTPLLTNQNFQLYKAFVLSPSAASPVDTSAVQNACRSLLGT